MNKCRACSNKLREPFLSLGNSPLSNAYLSKDDLNRMEPYYPLDVYVCERCFLVQLEEFETAKNIFSSDYAYFSSYSESWLKHCREYTEMMINRFSFDRNSFVIEIASNDGYLLQYFKQHNIPILGIEPAANIAKVAIEKGIPTDIAFFDTSYAQKMVKDNKLADLIIGNNVLAHNPNLNDFVEALKIALKPGGVITIEFPHLLRLIEGNQFDTIYHEHFSYFSFHTVQRLFALHNLELFDAEEIPTHGGSLRIYVRHKGVSSEQLAVSREQLAGSGEQGAVSSERLAVSSNVINIISKEIDAGYADIKHYLAFSKKVEKIKRDILNFLIQAKEEGKTIVGYGAPAKGNTLLNYCGIRADFLDYTVDRSPHKQNKYLPGTHIPIKHPDKIKEDKPDYVLILPWNLKDEIMEQMDYIREWGGKFIVPIPEIKVL